MKKKILDALKTKYANLGVSDSVLDRVAENLAKTVTEEDGIEAAVSSAEIVSLLKAIQGEGDRLRNEKASLSRELEELRKQSGKKDEPPANPDKDKDEPPANPDKDKPGDDPLLAEIKAMRQEMSEMRAFRQREEKERRQNAMMASLKETMKGEKYKCDNEAVLNLTLKGFEFSDKDTVEGVAEVKSKEYRSNYESLYGGGYVPNMGGWADRGQSFDAKAEVARLQAEGKLPKPSDGQK